MVSKMEQPKTGEQCPSVLVCLNSGEPSIKMLGCLLLSLGHHK